MVFRHTVNFQVKVNPVQIFRFSDFQGFQAFSENKTTYDCMHSGTGRTRVPVPGNHKIEGGGRFRF